MSHVRVGDCSLRSPLLATGKLIEDSKTSDPAAILFRILTEGPERTLSAPEAKKTSSQTKDAGSKLPPPPADLFSDDKRPKDQIATPFAAANKPAAPASPFAAANPAKPPASPFANASKPKPPAASPFADAGSKPAASPFAAPGKKLEPNPFGKHTSCFRFGVNRLP
eukprot:1195019-Prorocentrum_minimum.AAC.2